jgi:hypothetical protein
MVATPQVTPMSSAPSALEDMLLQKITEPLGIATAQVTAQVHTMFCSANGSQV